MNEDLPNRKLPLGQGVVIVPQVQLYIINSALRQYHFIKYTRRQAHPVVEAERRWSAGGILLFGLDEDAGFKAVGVGNPRKL